MIISFDKVDINYGSNWDKHYPKIPQDEKLYFGTNFIAIDCIHLLKAYLVVGTKFI